MFKKKKKMYAAGSVVTSLIFQQLYVMFIELNSFCYVEV
jgi:hypothetical protein